MKIIIYTNFLRIWKYEKWSIVYTSCTKKYVNVNLFLLMEQVIFTPLFESLSIFLGLSLHLILFLIGMSDIDRTWL